MYFCIAHNFDVNEKNCQANNKKDNFKKRLFLRNFSIFWPSWTTSKIYFKDLKFFRCGFYTYWNDFRG